MRLLVLKADNLQSLRQRLEAGDAAPGGAERLQALNPHVDLSRLAAGAVLFVPPAAAAAEDGSRPADGGSFEALAGDLLAGLKAAGTRAARGAETLGAGRAEVASVLKTAALKRLLDADEALRQQLGAADARAADAHKQAQAGLKDIDALLKGTQAELERLGKLFD